MPSELMQKEIDELSCEEFSEFLVTGTVREDEELSSKELLKVMECLTDEEAEHYFHSYSEFDL